MKKTENALVTELVASSVGVKILQFLKGAVPLMKAKIALAPTDVQWIENAAAQEPVAPLAGVRSLQRPRTLAETWMRAKMS